MRAILLAIAAMIIGIVLTILWVAIYSAAIEPGRDLAYYQDYATASAPLVGIIVGIPILFVAGWFAGRGHSGTRAISAGAAVGIAYAVVDVAVLFLFAGDREIPWTMVGLSYATKIAASAAGGFLAGRKPLDNEEEAPI